MCSSTSLAAYLMNCLADCLQMAGTVMTHWMSVAVIGWSAIAISVSSFKHVSRKNLSEWENTTVALTLRPLVASSSILWCNSCNTHNYRQVMIVPPIIQIQMIGRESVAQPTFVQKWMYWCRYGCLSACIGLKLNFKLVIIQTTCLDNLIKNAVYIVKWHVYITPCSRLLPITRYSH